MQSTNHPDVDRDTGVIAFCGQDWWYHNRAHSDFQLMIRAADRQRVLLINSIGMRMPTPGKSSKFLSKIVRKLKSMAKFLRRPQPETRPNLFVMTPVAVPVFGIPGLKHAAAWFVRTQVRLASWWLGIKQPLILVTPPTAWGVVRKMKRRSLVYNRSDKHSAFKEADTQLIEGLEQQLMQHADHVIYAARELMAQESGLSGHNARFLDHGVDEGWLADQIEAKELANIPHPRIGFFGGLRAHLVDMPLLERLAESLPDHHLVLIGDAPSDVGELIARENVHWFHRRDHQEIPSFGAGFDVALMPYLTNDWIRHCNPIKLKEYLALGLPVVSSDFPEARRFAPHVHIAKDHDEYVRMVTELAAKGSDEAERKSRRDAVRDTTWARQADLLLRITRGEDVTAPPSGQAPSLPSSEPKNVAIS